MSNPKQSRVLPVEPSLRSSAVKDVWVGQAPSRAHPHAPHKRHGLRDQPGTRPWSLDQRLAARTPASSVESAGLARNDGRRPARGSVLRRLILALPEIRAPDRAPAPLSVDSAPAIDQPSTKERFGRSQPARRAKPEASAREKKVENPPHLRARWPPRRPSILSGREEPTAGARPRETPISPALESRKQKNPTPKRNAGKPSRAGGATSPLRQWTSSRGSNLKGMDDEVMARTAPRRERRHQMSAR